MEATEKLPKTIKKSLAEIIKEKINQPWSDCGRENFVLDLDGQIVCLEYKKDETALTGKKITFKLEPTVFYNGEHPVYRN